MSNPAGRFETAPSTASDDGWEAVDDDFPDPEPATAFYPDKTRNIIATNRSPDVPFEQSINPYKGCEHGCVYCYARPTHAFLDLSPGLDFETRIFYKTDPVERLFEAFDKPGYECRTLAIGTNTDPYQPGEKGLRVTRRILEALLDCRHPVSIVTKGALILRDLDILGELAGLGLVSVGVSITTLDNELKTKLEPRTASPGARLRMVRELKAAGVPVGIMLAPVIPFINDHEIETVVARSAEAGAEFAGYVMLRLPFEVKDLFEEWLAEHYPLKAEHVMSRVREMRGGKSYQAEWGVRMRGQGVYADLVAKRFEVARRKHGLDVSKRGELRTDLFRRGQGTLF
ncbi:MAG: PA0069 family radical SAM protein [Gammaproteobacteria bacterium]|nr:PA0069 family radical SAM protein [Gammaproteobacteria bacterium]